MNTKMWCGYCKRGGITWLTVHFNGHVGRVCSYECLDAITRPDGPFGTLFGVRALKVCCVCERLGDWRDNFVSCGSMMDPGFAHGRSYFCSKECLDVKISRAKRLTRETQLLDRMRKEHREKQEKRINAMRYR